MNLRFRCYISGPITKGDLAQNVNQATAAFVRLAKAGLSPLCPHWSVFSSPCIPWDYGRCVLATGTPQGNPEMTHEDWLGVDLPWVEAADVVLRLPGESVGADREVEHAKHTGVPVFNTVEDVIAWAEENQELAF